METKLTILCLLSISFALSKAQNVTVPMDECTWRNGAWGQMQMCEGNELIVGACGSGGADDCQGHSIQILCCDMPDYHYENCLDFTGLYGESISCGDVTHDLNMIVEGACGSNKGLDCGGGAHQIHCCHGIFDDDTRLMSNGLCYWKYGVYGEQLQCDWPNEAVFGRCGAGKNDDCGTLKWHGIQCCQLTTGPPM